MLAMKRTFMGLAVLATLASGALAQTAEPIGLSVRAGLFFPSDGDAREEGATWFAVGADYKVSDLRFGGLNPGYSAWTSISADFVSKGDYRHVPVLFNYTARNNAFYYTAGLGVGFVRRVTANNDVSNTTELAYQVGVGYDFARGATPLFVEAKYFGSGKSEVNGFGVYAGIRL